MKGKNFIKGKFTEEVNINRRKQGQGKPDGFFLAMVDVGKEQRKAAIKIQSIKF
jgi:hypothetical protein